LAAGDLQGLRRTLDALDAYAPEQSFSQQVRIQTLRARLLLAQGEVEAARLQIEHLLPAVEESQDRYNRLEIQILLALAHAARKEDQVAQQWLMRVLAQTCGEGFLRIFLNEGEPLARILRVLAPTIQDKALRSYVRTILRAFTATGGDSATVEAVAGLPAESLSAQEQRVLRLLAAGSTNPEIAAALVISVNTVKDHIKHLHRKLGVNNRIQASEAARRLNLA
jgi:LuxR family maltose regulon positive regulatory protein